MKYYFLLIIFFASGFTSLNYQILWQKQLSLILGSSATSITAIISSFFLGFAIGGKIGDWCRQKKISLLKVYSYTELLICLWAILFPICLKQMDHLYLNYNIPENLEFFLRFLFSTCLILPATILMGLTVPVMSDLLKSRGDNGVRLAYGINTLGAVFGVYFCSFYFLPTFGIAKTTHLIIIINLIVAMTAFYISMKIKKINLNISAIQSTKSNFYLHLSFFICGYVSMGAEIVWLRSLGLFTSNGHFMYALFFIIYLASYSLGSLFLFPIFQKIFKKDNMISSICLMLFISLIISLSLLKMTPNMTDYLINQSTIEHSLNDYKIMINELYPIFVTLFLPCLLMGTLFPIFSLQSSHIGGLYFIGNIGSFFGAVSFGLFLISKFGIINSWFFLMTLLCIPIILHSSLIKNNPKKSAALFIFSISVMFFIRQNMVPLTKFLENQNPNTQVKVLRYKEGNSATVIVREYNDEFQSRRIFIDEQSVASTQLREIVDSKMLAHLPLLFHPNPKTALSVGFGSGGTAWSLTRYPIHSDLVEIEREVINSATLFPYASALQNSNLNIIIEDARHYLHKTKKKYDVIVTDVTNLQYKQNPNLYTLEYFQILKKHLNSHGIVCAWIPLASIYSEELKILVATFMNVFPYSSLWYMHQVPTTFAILMGTTKPLKEMKDILSLNNKRVSDSIREDLRKILVSKPIEIADFLLLDEIKLLKYIGNSKIHTDNHPILEYKSSFSFYHYRDLLKKNFKELLQYSDSQDSTSRTFNARYDILKNWETQK